VALRGEAVSACLNAQILWDADNAELFGNLCRRTLRFCDEGKPCPPMPADGWILLVSSERGLTSSESSDGVPSGL
jgi:hypothetical protein